MKPETKKQSLRFERYLNLMDRDFPFSGKYPRAAPDSPPAQNGQTYRIILVPGTITSINYQHRESTDIGFQGSPLLPLAKGTAKVTSRTKMHFHRCRI